MPLPKEKGFPAVFPSTIWNDLTKRLQNGLMFTFKAQTTDPLTA